MTGIKLNYGNRIIVMKAIVYTKYGGPEVLNLQEIPKPIIKENEILIRQHATTVNSGDVRLRKADPYLVRLVYGVLKPKLQVLGMVISGTIEEVGEKVTSYKVGDDVFGLNQKYLGCNAQYVAVPDNEPLAIKPSNVNFEEASSFVFGGHTALHFLKKATLQAGQKIMIYGASGAVGTSAIQIAKYYGAEVTAVTSTKNLDFVRSIGADHVIDYTQVDLTTIKDKYDVIYETVDKCSIAKLSKLLKPDGTLILGAVIIKGLLIGLWHSKRSKFKLIAGVAEVNSKDMNTIKELVEIGALKPVIDKTYKLEQTSLANEYVDQGHKKGNVVIKID
jgi:NADPH:quinone reductase-like Zn-dependent oxidoreductase